MVLLPSHVPTTQCHWPSLIVTLAPLVVLLPKSPLLLALKFARPLFPFIFNRQLLSPLATMACQLRLPVSARLPFIQAPTVNGVLPVGWNCDTFSASAKMLCPSWTNAGLALKPTTGT